MSKRPMHPSEYEQVTTNIETPVPGLTMCARNDVIDPFRPADPTHLGPAGDYWKVEIDHEKQNGEAYLWIGDEWVPATQVMLSGLLRQGIVFRSLDEDAYPTLSLANAVKGMRRALGFGDDYDGEH